MDSLNRRTVIIGVLSTVGLLVFLFFAYQLTNQPTDFPDINRITPTDHLAWSAQKKNILVEYSDFQCPACKNFHDLLQTWTASQSATRSIVTHITLVFRNYPLTSIHPNSLLAAYAAEAAGQLGKYWEMNNKLFSQQASWGDLTDPTPVFVNFAKELGLDPDRFKNAFQSQAVKDKVQADLASGETAGINATPTFFLNGKKIEVTTFAQFQQLLLSTK
ncbi:DsbA family protein [Patescibacteria group bacterium]|nr:DsbA family protein [Patescibacteria group bacterium]MCL5091906.1 DsbA family protein [Patescibacteria group bacterium]